MKNTEPKKKPKRAAATDTPDRSDARPNAKPAVRTGATPKATHRPPRTPEPPAGDTSAGNQSGSVPEVRGSLPGLPDSLRPGGALDRTVRAPASGGEDSAIQHLRRKLSADLDRFHELAGVESDPLEAVRRFGTEWRGSSTDISNTLLCLTLAREVGADELAERCKQIAYEQYLERRPAYDQLLGAFVPDDIAQRAERHFARRGYEDGTNPTAAVDWDVYVLRRRRAADAGGAGLTTGLPAVDAATGGLRGLNIVAGPAGVGKTTFALGCARSALRRHPDLAVLVYSMDMPKDELYDSLLAAEAGLDRGRLHGGGLTDGERERVEAAGASLKAEVLPRLKVLDGENLARRGGLLRLSDRPGPHDDGPVPVPPERLHWGLIDDRQALCDATGAKRALVVFDYLQLIDFPSDYLAGRSADHVRIDVFRRFYGATQAGLDRADCLLLISEVRKTGLGGALSLADVMGASRVAYGANEVLLLEPAGGGSAGGGPAGDIVPVTLRVAKSRHGRSGTEVPLAFEHRVGRFTEAAGSPSGRATGNKAQPPRRGASPTAGK